jgi:putative Mg2+ transporter-C (MgtC) family protein
MIREKEAGIRTHFVLAVGATLVTCVSLSFPDNEARIAAQIVSGIGFLGAGMIVFRGETLHGLTTAAGIWTAAGIGIAVGNGLYTLALGATIIVVAVQSILHKHLTSVGHTKHTMIKIKFIYSDEMSTLLSQFFQTDKFSRFKAAEENGVLVADIFIKTAIDCDSALLAKVMNEHKDIIYIERLDARL